MRIENNQIIADQGCRVRRVGTKETPASAATILPGTTIADFEERTDQEWTEVLHREWMSSEYSRRLSAAIHERYSLDDEAALSANMAYATRRGDEVLLAEATAEMDTYQAYRQECKRRVRAELEAETVTDH